MIKRRFPQHRFLEKTRVKTLRGYTLTLVLLLHASFYFLLASKNHKGTAVHSVTSSKILRSFFADTWHILPSYSNDIRITILLELRIDFAKLSTRYLLESRRQSRAASRRTETVCDNVYKSQRNGIYARVET